MEEKNKRKIVISKEKAVFWMDKNGIWHNEHGKFEHPRIIKYFNASIRKDEQGYFVYQATDEFEEKVYFPYEDTALFVVDVSLGREVKLRLNTGNTIVLEPENLFSENDCLYLKKGGERVKFNAKAMLRLAKYIKEEDDRLILCLNDQSWEIG